MRLAARWATTSASGTCSRTGGKDCAAHEVPLGIAGCMPSLHCGLGQASPSIDQLLDDFGDYPARRRKLPLLWERQRHVTKEIRLYELAGSKAALLKLLRNRIRPPSSNRGLSYLPRVLSASSMNQRERRGREPLARHLQGVIRATQHEEVALVVLLHQVAMGPATGHRPPVGRLQAREVRRPGPARAMLAT